MPRTFVPCRRCSAEHTNPRSSSLCEVCGPIEAAENSAMLKAEVAEKSVAEILLDDCITVDDLREWLRDHILEKVK